MNTIKYISVTILCLSLHFGCNDATKRQIFEEKSLDNNMINLHCTAWADGGPFTGLCGNPYSAVILTELSKSSGADQYKIIDILTHNSKLKPLFNKDDKIIPGCQNIYSNKAGDQFMIFAYEYEGEHTIAGSESFIRIKGNKDPIVSSIKKYINNKQDPLIIKTDLALWSQIGFGAQLKQIIQCHEDLNYETNNNKH